MERYKRQLLMPEIGMLGQKTLATGNVAIIGAGGLGGTCAIYLTVAGIAEQAGSLTLIDCDSVSLSNLNRQILYSEQDIGQPKVKVAAQKLQAYNHNTQIYPIWQKICPENIEQLLHYADVIIDAGDNFTLTYLLNDYAAKHQKPFISASVQGTEGYISVSCYSTAKQSAIPSLRKIFPHPPAFAESTTPIPIIGTTAGMLGLCLAQECIKVLLADPAQLDAKLLAINLWTYRQRIVDFG